MHTTLRPTNPKNRRKFVAAVTLLATLAAAGCASSPQQSAGADADPVALEVDADQVSTPGDAPGADVSESDVSDPAPVPDTATPAEQSDDQADDDQTGDDLTGDDAEDAADLLDDSDDQQPEAPPAAEPAGEDEGDGGDDGPVDLDPVEPQPAHPCDNLVPDGSSLVVGPDPLVLEDGDLDGELSIVNCSDGDIDWTAKTKPSVALDDDGANLLPGETAKLEFEIDGDAWDPGAIDFKIKVSEPGHNHYIDIHAFRQLSGQDFVADVGLTAGPGAGGCANQCILSALLEPNFSTPNLGIDITTNTEATIRTWVSTSAPVVINDVPFFFGADPIDVSPAGVTSHHGFLSPLDAGTEYHIIVSATDSFDHTAYRVGTFTTITPVENPDGLLGAGDPPGCSNQCITKAQITAGADYSSKHISIASHTAAQFQVSVSTDAPSWSNGVPSFAETDLWVPSGLEFVETWETDLDGLDADTGYHIIVRATDAYDNVDFRVGQFHTAHAPTFDIVYTVVGIHTDYDGDSGANRGELSFAWRVGQDHAGYRAEEKIHSNRTVTFPASESTFVAQDVEEWLPTVIVQATERDPDGLIEFCSAGIGAGTQYSHNDDCDTVSNVAVSGLYTLDTLTNLPFCTQPGLTEHRCLEISTFGAPSGYPEITATVAINVVD